RTTERSCSSRTTVVSSSGSVLRGPWQCNPAGLRTLQPSRADEPLDELRIEAPAPREPAWDLALGCNHTRAHAGDDQLVERWSSGHCFGKDVVPAGVLESFDGPVLSGLERAHEHRSAELERVEQLLQRRRLQTELGTEVLARRRTRVGEVVEHEGPVLVL